MLLSLSETSGVGTPAAALNAFVHDFTDTGPKMQPFRRARSVRDKRGFSTRSANLFKRLNSAQGSP